MEKAKVAEILLHKVKSNCEGNDIIEAMEIAIGEMEVARSLFNNALDPKLIEVAIYSEEVAKKRYDYLLKLAKTNGLKVSREYVIEQCSKLAK